MSENILVIENLTKRYGSKTALNSVNLTLEKGKIIGLLGPNGSGKTTMLKILAGMLTPTSGSVEIAGFPVGTESKAVTAYLPDRECYNGNMKIQDLTVKYSDFFDDFDADRAGKILDDLGILTTDRIKDLSKGNREKVQLIMTMSRRAELYLLDEPIGGVDPAARDYIIRTILTNYNSEGTVIIATHLIEEIEQVLDEVIFLKDGQIDLHDTVDNIREKHQQSVDACFREEFKC